MGRPSKLTPDQWAEIARRSAEGESTRSLAKEFGLNEASVRAKVSTQTPRVREVAAKVADAQEALASLPVSQQYTALSLAEQLRGITRNLASAAAHGADTARRLKERANAEAASILEGKQIDVARMAVVAGLTKLANESASIAQGLMASAGSGMVKQHLILEAGEPDKPDGADDELTPTFNITLSTE